MQFLQTKLQVKSKISKYYDLYYTVIKNRNDEENLDEKDQGDYITYDNYIIPKKDLGIKPRETFLR